MCLTLSLFARRKKARRDIEVAKVLIVPLTDDGLYGSRPYTPYQRYPVEFNQLYTSYLMRDGWEIEDGLHSYADFSDAYNTALTLARWCYNTGYYTGHLKISVFKAIIPKGSFYYFGKHGDAAASYASDQLIITNEILGSIGD